MGQGSSALDTRRLKRVIWTDETSVVLGRRRGAVRVWRTKYERFAEPCVRARWKKASEFIFWACFSYDKKGPCYCWKAETAAERKIATAELARLNADKEAEDKANWELQTAMSRINLRGKTKGRKPIWKHTAATGQVSQ